MTAVGEARTPADRGPTVAVALIAFVHVLALPLVPPAPSLLAVAVIEGIALAGLAGLVGVTSGSPRVAATAAVAYAVVVGATWTAVATGTPDWSVALGFGTVLALVGYGLHRYELVTLGLVEVDDE